MDVWCWKRVYNDKRIDSGRFLDSLRKMLPGRLGVWDGEKDSINFFLTYTSFVFESPTVRCNWDCVSKHQAVQNILVANMTESCSRCSLHLWFVLFLINSQSAHNQLTISSQSAHNQLTINSQSAHNQLTISSQSAHNQLTFKQPSIQNKMLVINVTDMFKFVCVILTFSNYIISYSNVYNNLMILLSVQSWSGLCLSYM